MCRCSVPAMQEKLAPKERPSPEAKHPAKSLITATTTKETTPARWKDCAASSPRGAAPALQSRRPLPQEPEEGSQESSEEAAKADRVAQRQQARPTAVPVPLRGDGPKDIEGLEAAEAGDGPAGPKFYRAMDSIMVAKHERPKRALERDGADTGKLAFCVAGGLVLVMLAIGTIGFVIVKIMSPAAASSENVSSEVSQPTQRDF
ncbi:uncharacterized protein LOC144161500 [Haemaphysalis longicornis]